MESMAILPNPTDRQKSRAVHINMIVTGNPRSDFPSEPSMYPYINQHITCRLILCQCNCEVRCEGHIGTIQVRGPYTDVIMSLVLYRQLSRDGDLLPLVGCIHIKLVVVDSDAVVGVVRFEGCLEGGGEEIRARQVEVVHDEIFEVVSGFGWA